MFYSHYFKYFFLLSLSTTSGIPINCMLDCMILSYRFWKLCHFFFFHLDCIISVALLSSSVILLPFQIYCWVHLVKISFQLLFFSVLNFQLLLLFFFFLVSISLSRFHICSVINTLFFCNFLSFITTGMKCFLINLMVWAHTKTVAIDYFFLNPDYKSGESLFFACLVIFGQKLDCVCCCCSVAKLCLTFWPHGLQPARLPCPSLFARVC